MFVLFLAYISDYHTQYHHISTLGFQDVYEFIIFSLPLKFPILWSEISRIP